MTSRLVFDFLKRLAQDPELTTSLRTLSKSEVLERARQMGYGFTESDFDDSIWGIEMFLAEKLGERFDPSFSLWETMWGKYYLEYLVDNVQSALSSQDIEAFLMKGRASR